MPTAAEIDAEKDAKATRLATLNKRNTEVVEVVLAQKELRIQELEARFNRLQAAFTTLDNRFNAIEHMVRMDKVAKFDGGATS